MSMPFPIVARLIGGVLVLLGLVAFFGFAQGQDKGWTALIPAFAGAPIFLCSLIAMISHGARRHSMHLVAVIALLGILAPLGRLIPKSIKEGFVLNYASFTQIAMAALCALLLFFAIRSFVEARRARQATR